MPALETSQALLSWVPQGLPGQSCLQYVPESGCKLKLILKPVHPGNTCCCHHHGFQMGRDKMRDASLATQHSEYQPSAMTLVSQITAQRAEVCCLRQSWALWEALPDSIVHTDTRAMIADAFRSTEEGLSPENMLTGMRRPLYALVLGFALGFNPSICPTAYISAQLILSSIYLSVHLSFSYVPIYSLIHLSSHLYIHIFIYLPILPSIHSFIYLSSHPPICASIHPSFHLSIYPSTFPSFYPLTFV